MLGRSAAKCQYFEVPLSTGGFDPYYEPGSVSYALLAQVTVVWVIQAELIPDSKLTDLRRVCHVLPPSNYAILPMGESTIRQRKRKQNIIHPNAGGIDIGSRSHVVSVPPDLDDEPTRTFNGFTDDLKLLVQWLAGLDITTVAMESTGIYWILHYELLSNAGLEVYLVNARLMRSGVGIVAA